MKARRCKRRFIARSNRVLASTMSNSSKPELDRWAPRWGDDQLYAAIPLQRLNKRGIPHLDFLNELFDSAYRDNQRVYIYPVWEEPENEDVYFVGLAIADEEWITEGPEGQRQYWLEQMAQDPGWAIDWTGQGVLEFPFERINECLYLLYQRELDEEIGRYCRIQFHLIRAKDHDERYPIGILLTTTYGDEMSPEVAKAMYNQLMES